MCRIHEIWSNSAGGKRNTSRFGWLILSSGYHKKGYPFFGPKKRRIHSKVYDITIKKAEFILRKDVFINFVCVFIKKYWVLQFWKWILRQKMEEFIFRQPYSCLFARVFIWNKRVLHLKKWVLRVFTWVLRPKRVELIIFEPYSFELGGIHVTKRSRTCFVG